MPIIKSVCLIAVAAICLMSNCSKAPQEHPAASEAKPAPFVFIHRLRGYPLPNEPTVAGVLVALWSDGRLVRVASGSQAGQEYIQGRVGETEVQAVRSLIASSGLLESKQGEYVTVDASSDRLVVRLPDGVHVWAHSPGFHEVPAIVRITDYLLKVELSKESKMESEALAGYPREWYAGWQQ
jgi:hypothetical protein